MKKCQNPCQAYKQILSAYLDRELSLSHTHELEAHLVVCSQCQKELASFQAALEMLSVLEIAEPHCDLDFLVMSRIEKRKQHPLCRLAPASMGMAVLGLAIGVLLACNIAWQTEPIIAENDGIMLAMDVFSPSPKGSFSSTYLTIINDPGR